MTKANETGGKVSQQDLEYAKLYKKTGDPYYLPENYKKRHSQLFKKNPLKKFDEVSVSHKIDWQNEEKSKPIILRTVTVADPNPFATPQEILGKWKRELEKMMVSVGWTLADDIYKDPVKVRRAKEPMKWHIFLVMKKSPTSNRDAFFGRKPENLKNILRDKENREARQRYEAAKKLTKLQ